MILTLELLAATVMVLTTVGVHAYGLLLLARLLVRRERLRSGSGPASIKVAVFTVLLVLGLFVLHGVEIWLYAAVFWGLGATPDLREAVYFSTISYGAIGYSDAGVAEDWKLLGAIEGINGSILLGWSVVFFVGVMGRRPRRMRA